MLRSTAVVCGVLSLILTMPAQSADNYPSRPVRMVVPFAPGGASDFIARLVQPKLAQELGQQVVVDNRSGASGNIGVEVAAKALPDGYSFLLGNVGTMAINPSIFPKFPVRPVRDFVPVTQVVDVPVGLAALDAARAAAAWHARRGRGAGRGAAGRGGFWRSRVVGHARW